MVGATGVINTWADLVISHWRNDQVAGLLAQYRGLPPVTRLGSLEKAFANARAREPAMKIAFIAFPGTAFSSEHHYGVFLRGRTALTERLVKPVLVDAVTGEVSASRRRRGTWTRCCCRSRCISATTAACPCNGCGPRWTC